VARVFCLQILSRERREARNTTLLKNQTLSRKQTLFHSAVFPTNEYTYPFVKHKVASICLLIDQRDIKLGFKQLAYEVSAFVTTVNRLAKKELEPRDSS
jgi:hypothetical protein